MNNTDFTNPSGVLVTEMWNEQAYLAFVPNPLPPSFEYDRALVFTLAAAERKLGELSGLGRAIPNPLLLVNPFSRQEAVLSSRIEGTQTDMLGLYAYEARQLPLFGEGDRPRPRNDEAEVHNYLRALDYGMEALRKKPLTLNLLKEMHRILLDGVRGGSSAPGQFRSSQNYISGDAAGLTAARYVPPPARELMTALDLFEKYLHEPSEDPPLIRLAWLHYQFEAIHPFLDGNGRIGRLIITLLLTEWNLLPAPLLYLSAYFEKNRSEYYDRLLDVSRHSLWREWTLYFLQGVATQAEAAIHAAQRLQDLQQEWRQKVQEVSNSSTTLQVVDMLFESPFINARKIVDRLNVSQPTANNMINLLRELGILRDFHSLGRGGWYVARGVLP